MSTVGNDAGVEHELYRLLTKTFILLDDYDRQFFAEYGLSTRQYWALQHLDEHHGCSMVDLSRVLFTEKSNVTGIVDRLERLNLVARSHDLRDRRIVLITLTPEGLSLRDTIKSTHDLRIHALMGSQKTIDLSSLVAYLHTLSHNIETSLAPVANQPLS